MAHAHFIMIGGFLGAGKTTLISQLARRLQVDGKHVCIVTNDQAAGLVDTELLKSQGFDVNEVAGSCFCCNFDGLTGAIAEFDGRQKPDVVLAEPVGSCTDLIATIAIPMQERLGTEFTHSPYAVVLKPSHGMRILTGQGRGGFSPKAEYIFLKQLEESELIIINRIDELPAEQIAILREAIEQRFPGRRIVLASAKTGQNLDEVYEALLQTAPQRDTTMQVDYDVYADGEAELGWLNARARLTSQGLAIELDRVVVELVEGLKSRFAAIDAEPAHLKVLATDGQHASVANLISSDSSTMLSVSSESADREVTLTINARVRVDPQDLEQAVRGSLQAITESLQSELTLLDLRSFRPGRPEPTHRVERG